MAREYKLHPKNPDKIIPGNFVYSISEYINRDIRRRNEDTNIDDNKNRKYVKIKINEYIQSGLSEEEALDKIMKDDIVNKFEYLTENGLNIRECFRNWARAYVKENKGKDFTR